MDLKDITDFLARIHIDGSSLVRAAIAVFVLLLLNRIIQMVFNAVNKRRKPGVAVWTQALFVALGPPLRTVIWIVGLTLILRYLLDPSATKVVWQYVPPTRDVLIILSAAWFLFRMVKQVGLNLHARAVKRGDTLDPTAADAISKLARVVIAIIAVLVIMQTLGFSITGLLAFGGAAGIAVGFAAQSLVANLFGGMTIFATRMFRIGEEIIIPGTTLAGTVEKIGWRSTLVLGWDHKPFYVPNSQFNTSTIINHSRLTSRRIMEYLHVRYQDIDKVEAIIDEGNDMIANHPEMEHDFWVLRFDSYGDYSLKLFLYGFAATQGYAGYMRIKQDVLLKLSKIITEHGAELALPVSQVYLPEGLQLAGSGNGDPALQGLEEPPGDN